MFRSRCTGCLAVAAVRVVAVTVAAAACVLSFSGCKGSPVGEGSDGSASSDGGPDSGVGDGAASDATSSQDGHAEDPDAGLSGPTRIGFLHNEVPTVTDGEGSMLVQAYKGPQLNNNYAVTLSRDGEIMAFCASDDYSTIDPYAGPIGQVIKLQKSTMCKDARPSLDKNSVVWVEYGTGVSPPQRLRISDLDGNPLPGDGVVGSSKLGTPWFVLQDTSIVTVITASTLSGPLWRFDIADENQTLLVEDDVMADFDVCLNDTIGMTVRGVLFMLEPTGDASTLALSLRDDFPDAGIDNVEFPSFDPSCSKVAFLGRTGPGGLATEVLVYDMGADQLVRITDDQVSDLYPVMGGEGEWVYWVRDVSTLVRARADGTGGIETLVESGVMGRIAAGWPEVFQ